MSNSFSTPPEIASLMGLVDTFIRWRGEKQKHDRKYVHYHPSEFGGCLRKQQYKHFAELGIIKVEKEVHSSQKARLFDKGHNMHRRWQTWYFAEMGILRGVWKCKNQMCYAFDKDGKNRFDQLKEEHFEQMWAGKTRVYGKDNKIGCFKPEKCVCGCKQFKYEEITVFDEDLNLCGHCDIVLDFSNFDASRLDGVRKTFNEELFPKRPIVVDMKTISDMQWKMKLMKYGPSIEYTVQLNIYTQLLDCEYGVLIFENKENSETAAYKIEKSDAVWEVVKKQAEMMKQMIPHKLLPPPKPSDQSDSGCKYCEFAKLCHVSKIWKDLDLEKKRKDFYSILL